MKETELENDLNWDVIIIGAGPAGMFAANELTDNYVKVLVVDRGHDIKDRKCPMEDLGYCVQCSSCDIMCGVGGAGTFSDGTLNLRPDIGGDLAAIIGDSKKAWDLVDYVDSIFLKYGAPEQVYNPTGEQVEALKRRAASVGVHFIEILQRHMGSDNAPHIIENFENDLKSKGIAFLLNTEIDDLVIENNVCSGITLKNGKQLFSKFLLLAPGRIGGEWVNTVVKRHNIAAKYGAIDIGVRVEVPAIIMDPITKINHDPKFHIRTKRYDDFVRTFCTNEHGFVVKERYEGFIGTNGHSMKNRLSENTNFAFLVRTELTEPLEDTTRYGKSVSKLATTIGGGKPILQRMGDLRRGQRSNWSRIRRNPVKNTLEDVTPGDISMAMPHRIVMDIIEGLEKLNEVIPGVASDSTLLYAPEVKFYAMELHVTPNMATNTKNLYAAGDGTGLSRDIINAAATGVLAGRGILAEYKKNN
ncbi:MAG TPA: NAD(P)/FAD-dependent oxidoreductase [Candidatus Acidoferrales bacterium]|nr:NAD(P)/FAD-dependent oxidoreductase [Candidatus Acidoferrales bacterium]